MTELEKRFEEDMVEKVYRTTGRETGYWAGYFLRSVKRDGGIAAAKRLLQKPGVSKGLAKLVAMNRLDLAMETLVITPEYQALFTDAERAVATKRLDEARPVAAATPKDPPA